MSVKRQATTELNHDNWDQDDPADHEEMGTYKTAPKDVLEKRVIRTAKRRSQLATGDEVRILNTISSISTTQVMLGIDLFLKLHSQCVIHIIGNMLL